MIKTEELKDCPFCGGNAELDERRPYRNLSTGRIEDAVAVYCSECSAEISVCTRDVPDVEPEQVVYMWNNRRAEEDLATLVRRLSRQLAKALPGAELPGKAIDYLDRKGFRSETLRAGFEP